jgi:hypothetical protein
VTAVVYAVAGICFLVGIRAAVGSLRDPVPADTLREQLLIGLHEMSRAGFWLALGGFFLGYELLEEPAAFRWFAFVPLGMAAIRLATAAFLWRA